MMKKFTLVELIIACAVFGILLTILLPSLSNAREKAKIAVCLSNQRQTSTAYNMYAVQNNQNAVYTYWYSAWGGTPGTWNYFPDSKRLLNAYLTNKKVAWCPSDKGEAFSGSPHKHIGLGTGASHWNIKWNDGSHRPQYLDNFAGSSFHGSKLNITSFDRPDLKSLFVTLHLNFSFDWANRNTPIGQRMLWHDKKNFKDTVGFADGHAVFYHFWMKEISPSYNPASGKTLQWRWDNLKIY
jgi:type II secretory pathway pseudopilin PulG